ncbi:nitrilase-related carbon-nitrogen hydrolase [Tannerella forsythia]|uniref:nitrilase-related carbon-nitrogen hydrolase n=1 Tax=Tannerella forsythia TaxID=28112 RepID=UPI0028EA0099|nr:nitrilase-related carbon-nitrogen hydrolase [Tannerella forsythia]
MKVALISLDQLWEDKKGNQKQVEDALMLIEDKGVSWAIFPEMTLTGFTMNINQCSENILCSPSIDFFSKQAVKHNIYLSFGMILKSETKATNNLITISPTGEVLANYIKIHPFSYAGENKYYDKGTKLCKTMVSDALVGFSICYDLRFPELFQALSKSCKVIVNIANWPKNRRLHWETLIRARAIENQVFFIGVNRIGIDKNGLEYEKSSMVVDPKGDLVSEEPVKENISLFTIDSSFVDEYRFSFPVKEDRQVELYKQIL